MLDLRTDINSYTLILLLYILQALLDGGADPRIVAEDGANPEQVTITIATYINHFTTNTTNMLGIIW